MPVITLRAYLTVALVAAAPGAVLIGAAGLAGEVPAPVAGALAGAAFAGASAAGWLGYAALARRAERRERLAMLGDALSGTHDLRRIEEVVLRSARSALRARSGAVLVATGGSGELTGIVDSATPNDAAATGCAATAALRLPLGTGLLGSVANGSDGRCGRFGPDGPALAPGEPSGRNYVAVPLRRKSSVRGVLALYDRRGGRDFDDRDLSALGTLADQAAIAVENVLAHEEAQRLSHTDPLTGLFNYRALRESLRREVERANRFGHRLAVLVLDLDRFKEVNDLHGHAAGDAVLAEFARRLRAEIREVDLAFRQGGEEFVLLLPETDAAGGATVGHRLCAAVRSTPVLVPARRRPQAAAGEPGRFPIARRSLLGRRVPVTVSVGVAVFPEHGTTGTAVLQAADDALYAAKAAGRDTCRVAGGPATVVAGTGGGASGNPHPPRQTRGR
jgi:diguanylate cyclase (GGDEF)-like protein